MFKLRAAVRAAAVLGAGALVLQAGAANADNLLADGDGIAPLAASTLAFGQVCSGQTISKNVLLAVSRQGGGNVFANGAQVTFSSGTTPSGVTMAIPATTGGATSVTLPSNWSSLGNGALSDSVSGKVTLTAGAPGTSLNGSINLSATSTGLTRPGTLPVTASVVSCDTTPPTLSLPGPLTAEATGPNGVVVTYSATATDANPAQPTVTCDKPSGSTFPLGNTTVHCSATDAAGNKATGSFTVTVQDTTKPVLTNVPANQLIEATGPNGASASYALPTATDAVGAGPVSCSPASESTFPLGTTTVACASTDAAGNIGTAAFTVKVEDRTGPVIGDITAPKAAEATSGNGAVVTFDPPGAADLVSGSTSVTCASADHLTSGDTFPLGTTTVTCSSTDAAGNTSNKPFDVTVQDTLAPVLVVPGNITAEATYATGADVTYAATATDIVDGPVAPDCTPASGSAFALDQVTTVTCSATDGHNNTATESFKVTVVDTTPPQLSAVSNVTGIEATSAAGAPVTFTAPTATDVVDGSVPVTCTTGQNTPVKSGDTFPLGTTTVTCSATDAHHNSAATSFTVTVADTTPPAFDAYKAPAAVEATFVAGAVVTVTPPTATDAVSGNVAVTCDKNSGIFPLGTTTVRCSATDGAGNSSTTSFNVTVQDTTAPTLTLADQLVQASGPNGATVNYTPAATDAVDPNPQVSCTPASGSPFPIGTTTVNCTATDASGNSAKGSFSVTVRRTFSPGFFQPVDGARTLNSVKAGSTLPLKFEVFAGATELTTTDYFAPLSVQQMSCTSSTGLDDVEQLTTGGTALRYDTTAGQYIWNWKTPNGAGNCYQVKVATTDGAFLTALFKLR